MTDRDIDEIWAIEVLWLGVVAVMRNIRGYVLLQG